MSKDTKSKLLPPALPSPPPPPPPPSGLFLQKVTQLKQNESSEAISLEEELNTISKRLMEGKFSKIFHYSNTFLKPQLQDGPKCGLVALSIASSMTKNFVSVENIYKEAVFRGFTKQGEIFDARFLADLAEKCCGFKAKILEGGLLKHLHTIIEILLKKNLLLVPYDADFNHSPCCKSGFKAHWAVITGILIFEPLDKTKTADTLLESKKSDLLNCLNTEFDPGEPANFILTEHKNNLLVTKIPDSIQTKRLKAEGIYLIGLQGKSQHLGVWSFLEMAVSNENLVFVSPNRGCDYYVIPEGGLPKGLKGKAVVLKEFTVETG